MKLTVKEVCEKFWEIEEKYELNHMKIQNTYPWQLIRVYIYYEITRKLNIFDSAQQSHITKIDKIKSLAPFIKNSLLYNPASGKEKDVLIFDHPRKVMFKGEYQDIYSYFLPEILDEINKSYELIENPYLNKHYTKRNKKRDKNGNKYIKYNDKILLNSYIYKTKNRKKVPFTEDEIKKIDKIEKVIENSFSDIENNIMITIDLFRIIEDHILNFQYEYEKYRAIFEIKKPEKIFVVVGYENKAIIAAAKSKNIETIELQHGIISSYHLGYSYPEKTRLKEKKVKEIEYFPDKLLTFGDYWKNACTYPINSKNLITMGFPYFEENSKEFKSIQKNKENTKQILFISQGVIGNYLSKFAYELLLLLIDKNEKEKLLPKNEEEINLDNNTKDKKIEKYEIIYKLHPGEYETWQENYPYLNKSLKLNSSQNNIKFKVIDDNNIPLYELFAKSEYQIGAFSTAIYEGLSFNCKTFIIDVPGIEYLEDLIKKNIVKKVKNAKEVENALRNEVNENNNPIPINQFFKDYNKNIFNELF